MNEEAVITVNLQGRLNNQENYKVSVVFFIAFRNYTIKMTKIITHLVTSIQTYTTEM